MRPTWAEARELVRDCTCYPRPRERYALCLDPGDGLSCTRRMGHAGFHAACSGAAGLDGVHLMCAWSYDPARPHCDSCGPFRGPFLRKLPGSEPEEWRCRGCDDENAG